MSFSGEVRGQPSVDHIGRREFLRTAATIAASSSLLLLGPHAWAARIATQANSHKRLVVVFMRGAVDGLNVVVPCGEGRYYENRPTIAIPRAGNGAALRLDGNFGLNPALGALMPAWRDGTLAFVHACGSPDPTRSHFDAQDYIESGTPGIKTTADGWMNRTLAIMPGAHGPTEAVSLGPNMPRILSGRMPVANIPLGRAAARPMPLDNPRIEQVFDSLYDGSDPISRAYQQGRVARKKLLGELEQDMAQAGGGAPGPEGFSVDAGRLAYLIRHDPTIRLAFVALGGWDTHVNQGSATGQLANHLKPLGDGLADFARQLGPAYDETVILVISEFGRTAHENGNGGTDHGHGNVMWVMGGPVRGGRVYGKWVGLSPAELYQERDLAVTTDFREPIAQVLHSHMGISQAQLPVILPGRPADSGHVAQLIRT
ncbi:MAG TPA: DUF1501 domain-containing protein [Candidatus Binataceae bacterium]|nr:DUF1501 domain-containing protein [Candidatus Binataceae bacterium]